MSAKIKDTSQLPDEGIFKDINATFHEQYAVMKEKIKKRLMTGEVLIIIKMDSRLIAKCGEKEHSYEINGRYYHHLKALAHLPMACYFALTQNRAGQVKSAVDLWSKQVLEFIDKGLQAQLQEATAKFLEENDNSDTICHNSFLTYTRCLEPIFARLLSLSADDEVERLVSSLDTIDATYNKASSDIFLIVFGAHQPRYKELAKMVFRKWFSERNDHLIDLEHHVRYSETGQSIDDAIDLVVTAAADKEIAQMFLGDAKGLNQDVLGIVAKDAIARYWENKSSE
uniref:hypothetical protein n=1 Tax=Ningiella ruwaisensis TaxID=2364274 RepID=UPI0010A035E1|nr:hypothetical protein [Ningiella ruwaisensis]